MKFVLVDFLISLADRDNLGKYQEDPENYMSQAGLSTEQMLAVRNGDLYKIRRLSAREMKNSLHGKLLTSFYEEKDPEFKAIVELGPTDLDDVTTETDHNIVEQTDLGDDIAEFSAKYSVGPYYDHIFDNNWKQSKKNELVFVGSGITGANHLTAEATALISSADFVLYCVADLAVERKINLLNKNSEDLYIFYDDDKPRKQTYEEMVIRILEALEKYPRVCVVFYGHPGIFVWPSFKAIEQARKKGYKAYMLPAVSALDCLFSDVGFDPSRHSCQILEATDMLVRGRRPDVASTVILFQAGCVGDLGYNSKGYDGRNVPILEEYLISFYGDAHEIIVYEAAQYPVCRPRIERVKTGNLASLRLSGISTIYIPPAMLPKVDKSMLARLNLSNPDRN